MPNYYYKLSLLFASTIIMPIVPSWLKRQRKLYR